MSSVRLFGSFKRAQPSLLREKEEVFFFFGCVSLPLLNGEWNRLQDNEIRSFSVRGKKGFFFSQFTPATAQGSGRHRCRPSAIFCGS